MVAILILTLVSLITVLFPINRLIPGVILIVTIIQIVKEMKEISELRKYLEDTGIKK